MTIDMECNLMNNEKDLSNSTKQVVIHEEGRPVLKVESGTTLEVLKLLYETQNADQRTILGVRPTKSSNDIPCIVTLNETKLEHGDYDVIIKDPARGTPPLSPPVARCIDCSREAWKSKRFTSIGMNTEISINPAMEINSLHSLTSSKAETFKNVVRARTTLHRRSPDDLVPQPSNVLHTSLHQKEFVVTALPAAHPSNYESEFLDRKRTKICYPFKNAGIDLDLVAYDSVRPVNGNRIHQRVHSPPIRIKTEYKKSYEPYHLPAQHSSTHYYDNHRVQIQNSENIHDGGPPVYVLPNDFDHTNDSIDAHVIDYNNSKSQPRENKQNNNNNNVESMTIRKEGGDPAVLKAERDSPASITASDSGRSGSDESKPVETLVQRRFPCKICTESFPTKSTLYKHLRGHPSDEKPFKCNECGQGFTLSSNLRQHRIIHRGYKPFQCEFCGKKFMRSNVYKQHRRIHTGEQMHKCDFCPSEFLQKYALIKHLKKSHNVEHFEH